MSDGLSVRAAKVDELPEVGELTVAAFVADGFVAEGHPYADRLADTVSRHRDAELLVATDESERLLGTVTVCRPGTPYAQVAGQDELEFRMLAVHPAARGRGAGRALVGSVLERARAEGFRGVALSTGPAMRTAQQLYERLGFQRAPDRDWPVNESLSLLVFAMRL